MIGAAVDVGSNSVHLLVAELNGIELRYLRDESVLLGLGDVVDATGRMPEQAIAQLTHALTRYAALARESAARAITFIGTHPLRSAQNQAEICRQVQAATGLPLHVLDETAEATLTYLGATGGRPPSSATLVVDIGGGSTEVVAWLPGEALRIASLPSGSARLSNGIVLNDPLTPSELDRLRLAARGLVGELAWAEVENGLFVGGTATNLARIAPLSRDGLEVVHRVLTSSSQAELVERYAVNPRRAQQLAAGAALVEALLERYGLEAVDVSQSSLRDGAILARSRLGDEWATRLSELAAPSG